MQEKIILKKKCKLLYFLIIYLLIHILLDAADVAIVELLK